MCLSKKILYQYFFVSILSLHSTKALLTQPVITCSKLTIGTLEQGVKYVQS